MRTSHRTDHPRSRGVHERSIVSGLGGAGSSPLARGSRTPWHGWLVGRWDHPRSRGVHQAAHVYSVAGRGSSPLARGSRRQGRQRPRGSRIIPARAGFTKTVVAGSWRVQDHPRSRGVHMTCSTSGALSPGSSPLARGSRLRRGSGRGRGGIIPARAGFTSRWWRSWPSTTDHPRSRGVHTRGSLESQRRVTLSDLVCIHCRPSARSTEFR